MKPFPRRRPPLRKRISTSVSKSLAATSFLAGLFPLAVLFFLVTPPARSQVFVVGEKSATADVDTSFKPTRIDLPDGKLDERGRRELVRDLEDEQGFAHRAIPMGGAGVTLHANGNLTPGPDAYRKMIYDKGQAAAPGDRVMITALEIKPDRIVLDINGGPYAKHRFLSHLSINDMPVTNTNPDERPVGARITLLFEGQIPQISAPEVKALLQPIIDFGVKSGDQAYADTLPDPLKNAIASHEVLVGMTHRMVLAALGAPDSKMREQPSGDPNGARYEEWIYGHVPQTVRFVRFSGDRVVQVEIAEMGKPMQIHDKNEVGAATDPADVHEVALGDRVPTEEGGHNTAPTLREPGDPTDMANMPGKVQFPDDPQTAPASTGSKSSDTKSTGSQSTDTKPGDSSADDSVPLRRTAPSLGSAPAADSTKLR
jgi:hypothetical protein